MHIHIIGICGTFMGGIAKLAQQMGHEVTGCDAGVYPPMSDQLREAGIEVIEGFSAKQVEIRPDLWVVGNAISRGNELLEAILNIGLPYTSGPQWLAENILIHKKVMAVAGTHGKTTTTSMLTWILEKGGLNPSYLVGGVPKNFDSSARLTDSEWFVIEADEYDTAFFDKRSKFVHYHPRVAILNNLEYDHADIFPNLGAIETQFHHLVRTIPSQGLIVVNQTSEALKRVLDRGLWTPAELFSPLGTQAQWQVSPEPNSEVLFQGEKVGALSLTMPGEHNCLNALAAIAAARYAGISPENAVRYLDDFEGVKRRLELKGEVRGIKVIDDFAHHPTAIKETLKAQRERTPNGRILVLFEPRSNTMKLGVMKAQLPGAFEEADKVFCYQGPSVKWDVQEAMAPAGEKVTVSQEIDDIVEAVGREAQSGDVILLMSNGGFGGIQMKILNRLEGK